MMTDLNVICFHTSYQDMVHLLHSVCTAVSVGSTGGQQSPYLGACLLSCSGPPSGGQTLWRRLYANPPCKNMKKHQTNILTCRVCWSTGPAQQTTGWYLVKGPGKALISCCITVSLRITCADKTHLSPPQQHQTGSGGKTNIKHFMPLVYNNYSAKSVSRDI